MVLKNWQSRTSRYRSTFSTFLVMMNIDWSVRISTKIQMALSWFMMLITRTVSSHWSTGKRRCADMASTSIESKSLSVETNVTHREEKWIREMWPNGARSEATSTLRQVQIQPVMWQRHSSLCLQSVLINTSKIRPSLDCDSSITSSLIFSDNWLPKGSFLRTT